VRPFAKSRRRSARWTGPTGPGTFTIYPERATDKKGLGGNGVLAIKLPCIKKLEEFGWEVEVLPNIIDGVLGTGDLDALMTTPKGNIAFEWETGNISSAHRAINKLLMGLKFNGIKGAILVVPSNRLKLWLTERIGNIGELRPYFRLWTTPNCTTTRACFRSSCANTTRRAWTCLASPSNSGAIRKGEGRGVTPAVRDKRESQRRPKTWDRQGHRRGALSKIFDRGWLVGHMGFLLPYRTRSLFLEVVIVLVMVEIGVLHSFDDYVAVLEFDTDPVTTGALAHVERGASAPERIQYDLIRWVEIWMARLTSFVDNWFVLRFFDLNFQWRTGEMSSQMSVRFTPLGFIASRCPP